MLIQSFISISLLPFFVFASKRPASQDIDDRQPKEARTIAEEDDVDDMQETVVFEGDGNILDVWRVIFQNADPISVHHGSAVCKSFRNLITEDDPQLKAAYISPASFLEGVINGDRTISSTDKIPVEGIIAVLKDGDNVDVERLAKLLIRNSSFNLTKTLLTGISMTAEQKGSLARALLVAFSQFDLQHADIAFHLDNFDRYLQQRNFNILADFPAVSFVYPYLYLTSSPAITENILEKVLTSFWVDNITKPQVQGIQYAGQIFVAAREDIQTPKFAVFAMTLPYLDKDVVKQFGYKLAAMASLYHNTSHSSLHTSLNVFTGLMFSPMAPGNGILPDVKLPDIRRAVSDWKIELKEMACMVVAWHIPIQPILNTLASWKNLKSCTRKLSDEIEDFMKFVEKIVRFQVATLDTQYWDLAAELIELQAEESNVQEFVEQIWNRNCPESTASIIIKLLEISPEKYDHLVESKLDQLGWKSNRRAVISKNHDGLFVHSFKSGKELEKLFRVLAAVGREKILLNAIAQDVNSIWLQGMWDEVFDRFISDLSEDIQNDIGRYLAKHWFLPQAIYLSGETEKFDKLFTLIIPIKKVTDKTVAEALKTRQGLARMKHSVDIFGLDEETFKANLTKFENQN